MWTKIKKIISDSTIIGPFRVGRALAIRLWQGGCRFRMRKSTAHTWALIAQNHHYTGGIGSFWGLKRRRPLTFLPSLCAGLSPDDLRGKAAFLIGRPLGQAYWMNNVQTDRFFGDIRVESAGMPDIKEAWARGRCHDVPLLAATFCNTGDVKFRDAAIEIMHDWIAHTRYLHGVHWVGPMEVAIRAVNWIVALDLLADTLSEPPEALICSLYDHMKYLERRWEFYDGRTNNHYLSDLVGYLYLCWFFYDLPGMEQKWTWCMAEIEREFDWQVFEEGTSYEGSTQYHGLVMELIFFAKELARDHGTPFDRAYENKFARMAEFYIRCRVNEGGDRLVIGDDGSDSLLPFISRDVMAGYCQNEVIGTITYQKFGLTLINKEGFYISLRHAAYTPRQPSGHFHNDRASITIAYTGIPIIVDPGSYVYTRSPEWRNYFRSIAVHNSFFIEGREPGNLDQGLFVLPVADESECTPHRIVTVKDGTITVSDRWDIKKEIQGMSCWNFTCALDITLQQEGTDWIFIRDGVSLLRMKSDLDFERHEGWVSPAYGIKQKTNCLRARAKLSSVERTIYFVSVSGPSPL